MKTYIAGKISGLDDYRALFEAAKLEVIQLGHEQFSPIELPHNHNKQWISYMKECICLLMQCEAIYLIDNFSMSKGAKIEYWIARMLKYKIIFQ